MAIPSGATHPTIEARRIVRPTPIQPGTRQAITAPTRKPMLPIPNTMPTVSGDRPTTRNRYTSRIEYMRLLKRFEVPVHAAMFRRYGLSST